MIPPHPVPAGFAASIFDMDGLLIDSEILWHEAEIEILGGLGLSRDQLDVLRRDRVIGERVVSA